METFQVQSRLRWADMCRDRDCEELGSIFRERLSVPSPITGLSGLFVGDLIRTSLRSLRLHSRFVFRHVLAVESQLSVKVLV